MLLALRVWIGIFHASLIEKDGLLVSRVLELLILIQILAACGNYLVGPRDIGLDLLQMLYVLVIRSILCTSRILVVSLSTFGLLLILQHLKVLIERLILMGHT